MTSRLLQHFNVLRAVFIFLCFRLLLFSGSDGRLPFFWGGIPFFSPGTTVWVSA